MEVIEILPNSLALMAVLEEKVSPQLVPWTKQDDRRTEPAYPSIEAPLGVIVILDPVSRKDVVNGWNS